MRRVKLILPALTEATSPYWRPIKYSLFPPLGLATLAAYLDPGLEITLQDEHVEKLDLDDSLRPCRHSGLHHQCVPGLQDRGPLSRPRGIRRSRRPPRHITPGRGCRCTRTRSSSDPESTRSPSSCADFAAGNPLRRYESATRTLEDLPPIRRDLIQRQAVFGPELDRRLARMPAPLHVLLQGRLLLRGPLFLYAARGRRPCRNRHGFPAAIFISWTTISSGIPASRESSSAA